MGRNTAWRNGSRGRGRVNHFDPANQLKETSEIQVFNLQIEFTGGNDIKTKTKPLAGRKEAEE
jgi:hypothetical protein